MIGFSKIGQFKINREGFCDPVCFLDAEAFDHGASLLHLTIVGLGVPGGVHSCLDQQAAKLLNVLKSCRPGLFGQDSSQQSSERAHVPAQGVFFGAVFGAGDEFRQACGLISCSPQRFRHDV